MIPANKTAKIIKKSCPRETLLSFSVGDRMVIKHSEIKYMNLYPAVKNLEKTTAMRFTITTAGIADGTFVQRTA